MGNFRTLLISFLYPFLTINFFCLCGISTSTVNERSSILFCIMKAIVLILTLLCSSLSYADPLLIGYYSNQAQYRPGAGACLPSSLTPIVERLDVLNYTFLPVNYQSCAKVAGPTNDWQIHFAEWNDEELLKQIREKSPTLKILVSVKNLSIKDPEKCKAFITSLFALTTRLQLQGIDINGTHLQPLLQALRTSINEKGSSLLVSVTSLKSTPEELLSYAPFVDWFNIMPTETQEKLLEEYLQAGVPAEKLTLGVASSGECSSTISGYYTKKPGFLAYYEIVDGLENGLFNESQISYEKPEKAYQKGRFALQHQLKGASLMNLDTDNFMDPLCPFAITEALKEGLTP